VKKDKFLDIIDATPLVSIDLIVEDSQGRFLLGKRLNRPAQGYWFVPGGRIRKNETLADAMARISSTELGAALDINKARLLGAYDHIYDDNFHGLEGINTLRSFGLPDTGQQRFPGRNR
jgi:GDP-mannose mannosyl hydrolase